MQDMMTDGPEVATLTTAQALRQVADWLEAHPEITATRAFVPIQATDRAGMERFAAALGDRAVEKETGSDVTIEGIWGQPDYYSAGKVRVFAAVSIAELAGEPVKPAYEPILKPAVLSDELVEAGLDLAGRDTGDEYSVKRDTGGES